jgi:hypothetical protein
MGTTVYSYVMLGCKLPKPPFVTKQICDSCECGTQSKTKFCPDCGKQLFSEHRQPLFNEENRNWNGFVVNGYHNGENFYVGTELARISSDRYGKEDERFDTRSQVRSNEIKQKLKALLEPHDLWVEDLFGNWLVMEYF